MLETLSNTSKQQMNNHNNEAPAMGEDSSMRTRFSIIEKHALILIQVDRNKKNELCL